MCENGKHVNFKPSTLYVGGICQDCGNPVKTPVEQCECGAEYHQVGIINCSCEKCDSDF